MGIDLPRISAARLASFTFSNSTSAEPMAHSVIGEKVPDRTSPAFWPSARMRQPCRAIRLPSHLKWMSLLGEDSFFTDSRAFFPMKFSSLLSLTVHPIHPSIGDIDLLISWPYKGKPASSRRLSLAPSPIG